MGHKRQRILREAKRCLDCDRLLRSWNKSLLCCCCYSRRKGFARRGTLELNLKLMKGRSKK